MNRDKNRLLEFRPHPGFQEEFQKSQKKIKLITAGNQSGKTHVSAAEAALYALGIHPYKKIRTPNTGIIVSGQGFKTGIEQIVVPKLKQVTGSFDIVGMKKNSQGTPILIEWSNGSITHMMSSEQDDDVFEGTTVDWCLEGHHNVLMSDRSWKPIKEIVVGDRVISGFDSNMRYERENIVTKVFKRRAIVWTLKLKGGLELNCTPNHKWWVSGKGYVALSEMKIGDKLIIPADKFGGKVVEIIKEERETDVYDITVDRDHNFICEGAISSNCWIDEPVRRQIFIAIKRGMLTTGGHIWMSCTPLDEPWIYEELYLKGTIKRFDLATQKTEITEGEDKDIDVFEGCSDENSAISEEDKKEFKSRLTEDEIQARWFGKFKHLSGRVIKSYNPTIHRVPSFDIPGHWPVFASIDPHRNKPWAAMFLAISPRGQKYVCNEIYAAVSVSLFAEYFLEVAGQYNLMQTLIDTSAQEDGWDKESARERLQKLGIITKLAQKKNKKKSGIILINEEFSSNNLFVMEHCKRTHRELQNWIYKKNKSDAQSVLEEPEKKWDDQMDNLRYILVERPRYRGRAKIKEIGPIYVRG